MPYALLYYNEITKYYTVVGLLPGQKVTKVPLNWTLYEANPERDEAEKDLQKQGYTLLEQAAHMFFTVE